MLGKLRRWIRRHPILSVIFLLLWALLWAGYAENETGGVAFVAALVVMVLCSPVFLGFGWIIDRFKRFSNRETARRAQHREAEPMSTQLAATRGGDRSIALGQPSDVRAQLAEAPSPSSVGHVAEPAAPPDQSAFVETTHRPLPTLPQPSNIALKELLAMSPTEFEEFCVEALKGIGYKDVKRVGGAGDLAADIYAVDQHGRSTIAQCKRYRPGSKIGSPTIQTFIGMKNVHHQADRGIFITTADYSVPAIRLAKQHDLVLIDGDDLVKIAALVMAPKQQPAAQNLSGDRFCGNCGREFPPDSRFCPSCGEPRQT